MLVEIEHNPTVRLLDIALRVPAGGGTGGSGGCGGDGGGGGRRHQPVEQAGFMRTLPKGIRCIASTIFPMLDCAALHSNKAVDRRGFTAAASYFHAQKRLHRQPAIPLLLACFYHTYVYLNVYSFIIYSFRTLDFYLPLKWRNAIAAQAMIRSREGIRPCPIVSTVVPSCVWRLNPISPKPFSCSDLFCSSRSWAGCWLHSWHAGTGGSFHS